MIRGIYTDGWMGPGATVVMKSPGEAKAVGIDFYLSKADPPRRVALSIGGREIAAQTYAAAGAYTLRSGAVQPGGDTTTIDVSVDHTFRAAGDARELGVVVTGIGFGR